MTTTTEDSGSVGDHEKQERKTRTRSGCLNCRKRRRKCDENRPACIKCTERGDSCKWGVKLSFRPENSNSLAEDHPSMRCSSGKQLQTFKIIDVTSQVADGYIVKNDENRDDLSQKQTPPDTVFKSPSRLPTFPLSKRDDLTLGESHISYQRRAPTSERHPEGATWQAESPIYYTPNSMTASHSDGMSYSADDSIMNSHDSPVSTRPSLVTNISHHSNFTNEGMMTSQAISAPRRLSNITTNRYPMHAENAAADLLALRYMPSQLSQAQSISMTELPRSHELPPPVSGAHCVSILDHHILDDSDGIFLPGSAYQELHSTLRDHLIYTARSNVPTRCGTPEPLPDMGFFERDQARILSNSEEKISSLEPRVTAQREYVLWKTWIDEVAPWLDKFDNQRHFEHKIPMMAKTTPHLKNAILALCARQIERKANSPSSSESLALYQESIHLLLPELQSKNTAVIASCVILCVLEMMSCSPMAWKRHLEGCANLLEAVRINGFVGGLEEALFWCFARMDVCGALISQDLTLIPVHHWASRIDLQEDIRLFRNPSKSFDTYANLAVFLCANCVAYLETVRNQDTSQDADPSRISARWTELVNHLEDWYDGRPEEMKPILTIAANEGKEGSPFPTVLYGNGPAVSGNQLYHTAVLLMLQEKPTGFKIQRKQKSIFWHARQICAISESNSHHGAWTNSVQPMWIAGKVMSHPSEHRSILAILERIQCETGWVTSWRREDLKTWWGDSDD